MATLRWAGRFVLCACLTALVPAAAQAGPARERRLHLVAAEASSYLINDWNRFQENYLPLYVGDDDPRTAWDLKDEGIGEWIRVRVTPMEGATHVRMKVRNGYQKSEKLFAANSRARTLTVVLLPSKQTVDVDLSDTFGWQEIAVDQPAGPLEAVELRVKAVYPGKKYDDLCLSDVQLYVTATSADNPAYEKQHFDKILTWKRKRAEAARLFKTELGQALPIAAQYNVTTQRHDRPRGGDGTGNPCDGKDEVCWIAHSLAAVPAGNHDPHAAALALARKLADTKLATMTPVRIAATDKRPIPQVDGLCSPSLDSCEADPCEEAVPLPMTAQTGYLRTDGFALIEQSGLPAYQDVAAFKPAECRTRAGATFAWALRDAPVAGSPGRVRAVVLARCGMAEGREGAYKAKRTQLLVYGDDGTLELTADLLGTALLDWTKGTKGAKLASARVRRDDTDGGFDIIAEAAAAPIAAK